MKTDEFDEWYNEFVGGIIDATPSGENAFERDLIKGLNSIAEAIAVLAKVNFERMYPGEY